MLAFHFWEMKFYVLSLWLAGVLLESLLLQRAWFCAWFKKYPVFFSYLLCVFLQDVFFLVVYLLRFEHYETIYWYGEFFSILLGAGVTYEIFNLILGRYPGAGRMARHVLLVLVIIGLTKPLADAQARGWAWSMTAVELERNLRAVQALSLLVLALLVGYYRIPMGRNTRGIFLGYGMFIANSVVTLSFRYSIGRTFQNAWLILQPLWYLLALVTWCALLWTYEPMPVVESQPRIEEDYRSLAAATRKGVLHARTLWGKALRP